jgi:hypothetical protein
LVLFSHLTLWHFRVNIAPEVLLGLVAELVIGSSVTALAFLFAGRRT